MQLVADRFVSRLSIDDVNGSYVLDLATRRRVRLTIAAAGDAAEQRVWLIACGDRQRVRRCAEPWLLDCGRIGEARRFEAWVDDAPAARIDGPAADAPAVSLIDRPAVTAFSRLFETHDDRRVRVAACWGPAGSGRTTLVEQLAAIARARGFVPVDASLLATGVALAPGRTLFIVDDERARRPLGAAWLQALLRVPHAHVCLMIRSEEVRGVDGFALDRVSLEALLASVAEPSASAAWNRRVRRVAEQCHGLPGRFVRALWTGSAARHSLEVRPVLSRVAELPAVYGDESAGSGFPQPVEAPEKPRAQLWPAPGELAALRRRAAAATALIDAGRHAPGIRSLRQAASALARRDAWTDASRHALTLVAALLDRGRPREAHRVLEDARDWVARAEDPGALIDVALFTGIAWMDLARLDEAERVLSGTLAAARAAGDRPRVATAATALSRVAFWRGQYAEAIALVGESSDAGEHAPAIRRLRALARASMANGECTNAMTALDAARNLASNPPNTRSLADVDYTSAWIRLAVGDLDGVDRDTASCAARAREARRPLRSLGASLLRSEADRRRGVIKGIDDWMSLRRRVLAATPLARAQFDFLRASAQAPDDRAVLRRHMSATGLKALEVFGSAMPRISGSGAPDAFVDDVLGILRVCQHADDELAVLKDVCTRVRQHLNAATIAFVATLDRRLETLALDGARMDVEIGDRAIAARLTIAPHRVGERLDAAAPVHYGGAVIGALCARWTVGTPYDLSRAAAVLTMAATAGAPVLSSVLVKRSHAAAPAALDLMGVTPAIAELRQSIERAASAPFPVLIEGESGSGKELVARAIHRCGPRRDRPFATLNCAALPDDLVEAELFGHARGSFTGAVADRPGVFEEAHSGTLFLDEVGELSPRAQAKLLRVIQEGELRRIGENLPRRVDVRIVCATNRQLRVEAEAGRFRQDLLYRLDVVRIVVPSLRERREDVPVLVDHYWTEATRRVASRATLSAETRAALAGYHWPGNVRELQNVLAALAVRSPKRGVVQPAALPAHVAAVDRPESWRLDAARQAFEASFVRAALVRSGGQRVRAAAELGVTRQGLTKLLNRLGIE